jgi:predicted aspartyl protease
VRSKSFPYDRAHEPPAPVVPVLLTSPLGAGGVVLPALIDTGADCTLMPTRVARQLKLPMIGRIRVKGVTGNPRAVAVYAARLQLAGFTVLARIAALGSETILGRDLLNRWRITLDGPRLTALLR